MGGRFMSTPLTRHIKTFNPNTFPSDEILDIIAKVLRKKMHERNIWDIPPSLLGYPDYENWNDQDAFWDIRMDCYEFAVLKRFKSLKTHISNKENIDGLVFLNISHFLQERQQASDPEGHAIFKNVESVLHDLKESKLARLENLRNKEKIRNETMCIFDNAYAQKSFPDYGVIKQIICRYKDFGAILNHVAILSEKGKQSVATLILLLKTEGVSAFYVEDLVNCLKNTSRYVASEIPIPEDAEKLADFQYDPSEEILETIDATGIHEKIKKEIDKLKINNKVKLRLHYLLTVIINRLANGEDVSVTEIAREIGKSKSTISEDWTLLKSLMKKL